MNYTTTTSRSKRPSRKLLVAAVAVVVVAGVAATAYHLHSVRVAQHTSGKVASVKTTSATSKTSPDKAQNSPNTIGTSDSTTSTSTKSNADTSVNLTTPFGTFISNHHPGANGAPTSEASTCNTTPGATCDIVFTNDSGITKDLGAKTADSNGAVYWSWDIKGGTLSSGSWQVSAIAKLGNQTQTATDAVRLVVQ